MSRTSFFLGVSLELESFRGDQQLKPVRLDAKGGG